MDRSTTTTSLLYEDDGVTGSNEIVLTFKLTRRKYGAMLPWFPAKPAEACVPCTDSFELPDAFDDCLDHQLAKQHLVFEGLLSFDNDRTSFDIEPFPEKCFEAIANGEWANTTQDRRESLPGMDRTGSRMSSLHRPM